jgi:hypothetical protein
MSEKLIQMCLEESLSIRPLPSNPIEVVCSSPGWTKLKVAESEVMQCCANSKCASVASYSGRLGIALPYLLIPLIRGIQNFSAPIQDIHRFIAMIHGNSLFQILPFGQNSLPINFEQKADCCAVWRVLRIVPFRGHTLPAAVHWIPIQPEHPGPRITVERPSKPLALLE